MITRKSASEIERMRGAGRIVAEVLALIEAELRPGVSTAHLDKLAERHIRGAGAIPSFKGYLGGGKYGKGAKAFPASTCISIDSEVVHGIPGKRQIRDGELVSVDAGAIVDGWHGDAARTFPVGEISEETRKLLLVTEESLWAGIQQVRKGARLSDIGHAVQTVAEGAGFSVVREYVGHGIGRAMHEEPQVPNYGQPGKGIKLKVGHVLAVEPMVNLGSAETQLNDDGWTVITADGSLSAHFEHSIAVTENGPEVLTVLD